MVERDHLSPGGGRGEDLGLATVGIVVNFPWFDTRQNIGEICSERGRQKSIENRVDAGVTVGQDVRPNLEILLKCQCI